MRQRRRLHCLAVFLVAASVSQVTTAIADIAQDRVLLAPVQLGGPIPDASEWRKEFDHRLLDVVRRSQRLAIPAPRRTAASASACTDASCARALVEKEQVDSLVTARVLLGADRPPTYRVSVLVFDRAHDDVRSREASCPACSELQAAELLSSLAGQLLELPNTPPAPELAPVPALPVANPTPAPLLAPAPRPAPAPRSSAPAPAPRSLSRPLGIALVTAGGAGLITSAIALGLKAAANNSDACPAGLPLDRACGLARDTTPGIATAAVTGILSIGIGVAGALLLARAKHPPSALALALSGRF